MNNGVLINPSVDAVIRAMAQGAAGWLVSQGGLTTSTDTIVAVILGLVSIGWSIWHKQFNA